MVLMAVVGVALPFIVAIKFLAVLQFTVLTEVLLTLVATMVI
jgi:hypothetical protein